MLLDGLPVCIKSIALAGIRRIALHDRAIHFLNKRCDEFGLEVVMSTCFTGRDFYCHAAFCRTTQSFVDTNQRFRRDFFGHIDHRFVV